MFIVFEGGDGVGKSTQIQFLQETLEKSGWRVCLCREPGSTPLGERIREVLLHQKALQMSRMSELLLFMAARAQVTREVILPALERGEVVLADRFLMSSIVYQGYAGGLDVEEIRQIGVSATAGIAPDLTIVLDASVETGKARRGDTEPDRLESESTDFHQRVRQGFLTEAKRLGDRAIVISAEATPETIRSAIQKAVCEKCGL